MSAEASSRENKVKTSPRVNSARLCDYNGHTVRMTGKVLRFSGEEDEMIMQASDGGEVKVIMPGGLASSVSSTYVEIIGMVQAVDEIKAQACINAGNELDLDLVNFVVEKWHDPRFESLFA